VTPDKPETGYGYIQVAKSLQGKAEAIKLVQRFVEKPDVNTAQTYLNEGGYYWNAGMFVLKASVWLKALGQFRPDILQATQAAWDKRSADNQFVRPGKAEFAAIPSESVDYAAMEQCQAAVSQSRWSHWTQVGMTWVHGMQSGMFCTRTKLVMPTWATY